MSGIELEQPYVLETVPEGRLFFRNTDDGQSCFVGVVDVPADFVVEHFYPAVLNDRLRIDRSDLSSAQSFGERVSTAERMLECHADELIQYSKWRKGAVHDGFEFLARATHMVHENPQRKWVVVLGACAKPLSSVPVGGLFDVGDQGLRLVSCKAFTGKYMAQVLSEPLWGTQGKFGLATSLPPGVYEAYVKKERERATDRDPFFAKYVEKMTSLGPDLMVYTREELSARAALAKRVVSAFLVENELASSNNSRSVSP